MKHLIPLSFVTLALAACVDTTGLSGESSAYPHPQSNPNAAVVVAEFGDLQCPSCKAAHEVIVKPMLAELGSTIRYEFHQFPLSSIHRYALDAAEASECAADQGKFWEYIDIAFTRQDELSKDALKEWAAPLGLDTDLFGRCLDSHIKRDVVLEQYEAGRELGVTGTPTFFVNGRKVESTIDAIRSAAQEAARGAAQML
jgi:protein-disulfide isomerase